LVKLKGGRDVIEQLQANPSLVEVAKEGLNDMALLMDYLEAFDVLGSISVDMSLARGRKRSAAQTFTAANTDVFSSRLLHWLDI